MKKAPRACICKAGRLHKMARSYVRSVLQGAVQMQSKATFNAHTSKTGSAHRCTYIGRARPTGSTSGPSVTAWYNATNKQLLEITSQSLGAQAITTPNVTLQKLYFWGSVLSKQNKGTYNNTSIVKLEPEQNTKNSTAEVLQTNI